MSGFFRFMLLTGNKKPGPWKPGMWLLCLTFHAASESKVQLCSNAKNWTNH